MPNANTRVYDRTLVLFAPIFAILQAGFVPQAAAQSATGSIEGNAYTVLLRDRIGLGNDSAGNYSQRIYLPEFEILLNDRASGATVATTRTNLFGQYHFTRVRAGDYQVCWKTAGWVPGCVKQKVTVDRNIVGITTTEIRPEIRQQPDGSTVGAFWGRVHLADGTSPWYADEYFALSRTASVDVNILGGATVGKAVTNVSGEYVIVGVSSAATLQTAARLDAARANLVGAQTKVSTGARFDLTLPTRRPILSTVSGSVGGQGVREAASGAQVTLAAVAHSPGGSPLSYDWRPAPGSGKIIAASGNGATWQPDPTAGLQTVYVLVSDRFGGYTSSSVSISIAQARAPFSGRVVTATGSPIGEAAVTVNGTAVTADHGGGFATSVALAPRYIVNVTARGFIPASKIYDHSGVYSEYRLTRAAVSTVDPGGRIQLVDNREGIKLRGRGTVLIQPGSLVGPDGKASAGPLQASFATIDVANDEMPGDFGAKAGTREVNLISYGAVSVELRDAGGRLQNLAPGKTAEVTFPVPPSLAAPPPSIALWSYNDHTGYWDDLGSTATLDPTRRVYVGNVRHFSVLNTDISKTDASCVRILLDNVNKGQLRAFATYVSGPVPFAQTNDFLLDDSLNVIRRLPQNSAIQIHVTDNTAAKNVVNVQLLDVNQAVLAGNQVNTGPSTPDLFPPVPYASCITTSIRLPVPTGSISRIPFLSFFSNPTGPGSPPPADYIARATVAYYRALDGGTFTPTNPADFTQGGTWSGGTRSTLTAWLNQAGINPSVQTGVAGSGVDHSTTEQTAYLNHNDLGFGRRMTIRKNGSDVYAFVTNFGQGDQNPNNAENALNAVAPGATVAMEYTTLAGASSGGGIDPRVIKFFVYKNGQLANSANLDGFGEKFVPGLCQNCHGGDRFSIADTAAVPTATADEVRLRPDPTLVGASFREFDLASLRYPASIAIDANGVPTDATQLDRFQRLNNFVAATNPQQAIKDLVTGWKDLQPTTAFNTNFTPLAWKGTPQQTSFYQQVVAKECRTCHVAFGATDPDFGHNWATYQQFQNDASAIQSYACGATKFMPHALITYRNFWLSVGPHMPDVLANPGVAGWTPFPAPGCT